MHTTIANSTDSQRLFSAISIGTLAFTSILTCSLVILCTFIGHLYKKPVNLLVANLASADLLLNIVNLVLQPPNILSEDKSFLCEWAGWITYLCGLQANWSVPVLALNRYVAIYRGDTYKRIFTTRNILLIIVGSWSILIAITLPFHVLGLTGYENAYENCGVNDLRKLKWRLLILFLLVIPTLSGNGITAYCNFKIFQRFREHAHDAKSIQTNVVARNKELMFVTLLNVAFACLLQGPYVLGKMIPNMVEGNVLRQIFPILYCLNSTLSSLCTLIVIRPYREAVKKLLRCRKIGQVGPVVDLATLHNVQYMDGGRRRSTIPSSALIDHCENHSQVQIQVNGCPMITGDLGARRMTVVDVF